MQMGAAPSTMPTLRTSTTGNGCIQSNREAGQIMNKTVQIKVKHNYGSQALYPHNEAARTFANLAWTKKSHIPECSINSLRDEGCSTV
jgi:hypothetical protein